MKNIDLSNMPNISLKSAISNKEKDQSMSLNLAERIYRLQVIKQLIRERLSAHSAEEFNESKSPYLYNPRFNLIFFHFSIYLNR